MQTMTAFPRMSGNRRWALKLGGAALAFGVLPARGADGAKVLRRGNGAEPDTLDPHLSSGTWENNIIGDMFVGLMTDDAASRPIPGCAESWTTSDDGLVWVFKLRRDVVWSDGVPLTAADFVYSWRRMLDPKFAARYAFILYVVKNAQEVNAGKRPVEDIGIRALDPYTLEITLAQPAPFLLGLLKHYSSFAVPPHVVEKHGRAWIQPGNMVSNGPYVLAEYVPNSYVKTVKNPKFYAAKDVEIEEVYFYPIDDERSALTQFRAGGIDMNVTTTGFPVQQLSWLKENLPGQARITPYLGITYAFMNQRRPRFNDVRVRRAMSLAIDRELLMERVVRDGSQPAYSFVPPGVDNYTTSPRIDFADWPMERRRAEAKELLAAAGYGPDKPLAFDFEYRLNYDRRRLMVALCTMLKDVGIVARPFGNESKIHYNKVQQGDYDVAEAGWVGDYNDPQTFLSLIETSAGVFNYARYSNAAYDRLMAEAKVMLDLKARAEVMSKAEQIALDECGVIPIYVTTTRCLVSPRVEGYEDNVENWHRTRFMRLKA
ncbi:MAG: peptide ABC transporter substrate-binding protein [Rhodospirillaceae bacterium]|nr:peptide ABC transporter substrate-binding protein [Rhodospirillaceae bacterium]